MQTTERDSIIRKLNKLKNFIERDCGPESQNARDIADRLVKQYNISSAEFSYVWHTEKAKLDEQKARAEKAYYDMKAAERARAEKAKAESEKYDWTRVSYTSSMREIVLALIRKMQADGKIQGSTNGSKIFVRGSMSQVHAFRVALDTAKRRWQRAMRDVNSDIIERINNDNY